MAINKNKLKIALACDHRGFKLKTFLAEFLKAKGCEISDFGTFTTDSCDYPDYIYPASLAVKEKKADKAVVICYTGVGSCIAANKVKGVRAALVFNKKMAILCRQHNDSNVLVLPAYLLKKDQASKIVWAWLNTEFEGGRHIKRLQKIEEIEEKNGW